MSYWKLILLIFFTEQVQAQFGLGYDFSTRTVDGRILLGDMAYAGFKLDPGINTWGDGDDININLDLFGRMNIFRPAEGFGLGPEGALKLIRGSELDIPEIFINFSADMIYNLNGPVYLYGHVPLIGLQVLAYDNGPGDNMALNSFASGFPTELGFLMQF